MRDLSDARYFFRKSLTSRWSAIRLLAMGICQIKVSIALSLTSIRSGNRLHVRPALKQSDGSSPHDMLDEINMEGHLVRV